MSLYRRFSKLFTRSGTPKVSTRTGPNYLPGDLVRITLPEGDTCNDAHNGKGVITHGPDDQGGWIVNSAPGGLRCVASELTMMTPREERN